MLDDTMVLACHASPGSQTQGFEAQLDRVQSDLFDVGAYLAAPGSNRFPSVSANRVADLEQAIDAMEDALQPLKTTASF